MGGPLVVSIFWLTVSFFGVERRRLYLFMVSYMCYFFAIPLGLLIPLDNSGVNYTWLRYIADLLLFIGVCGFGLVFVIRVAALTSAIYKNHSEGRRLFSLGDFTYYSLTDYAFWLNAVCFILAFTIITYFFWHQPISALDEVVATVLLLSILDLCTTADTSRPILSNKYKFEITFT